MKTFLNLLVLLSMVAVAGSAQVAPAARGGTTGVPITGNVHYAVRYAQSAQLNSLVPDVQTSMVSGSFSYMNRSQQLPFDLEYAGGYTWTVSGPAYQTGQFQHMLLEQGINWRKSKVLIGDNVMYLPQAPTIGFSGIPGTGEPIGTPNPAPATGQSILTVNTHVVDNLATGRYERILNYATTIAVAGGSELLRFPNNDGIDTNTLMGEGEVLERLSARNGLYGRYVFSQFSYPGTSVNLSTETGLVGFRRNMTRNLAADIAAGPEWISSTNSTLVPNTLNYSVLASLTYLVRSISMGANFTHGTNGGSGYLIGGEVNTFQGGFSRSFGQNLGLGLSGGYQRTASLTPSASGATNASFGGAESTYRVGRSLIFFVNYTATSQGAAIGLPTNVANQMLQTFGVGFGYSPREVHLRQ